MNIVMVTNTYTPHVGGVARSVAAFSEEYRRRGHSVLVVAPEFANMPGDEKDVIRIPAVQNFNGSDFSVVLPLSGLLTDALDKFKPDIIHSHHPYLLGMTALRIARYRELPLVFTHHTLYEQYTHYVPGDSPALGRFVVELATRYANLTDRVFAPSESIQALLKSRDVRAPISVVPTGVDHRRFSNGDGLRFRDSMNIPATAFVVGHVGRLAPEKNLPFLTEVFVEFAQSYHFAHILVAGKGPLEKSIRHAFRAHDLSERLHCIGELDSDLLADAYAAMDVFAFASKSETQGMVLTEAMAAGVPVVALDASGVREVVSSGENGHVLYKESTRDFAAALREIADMPARKKRILQQRARDTAEKFSMSVTASQALSHYQALCKQAFIVRSEEFEQWQHIQHLIKTEWDIVKGVAGAASAALVMDERVSGIF